MSKANAKPKTDTPLRFAVLIRVSTEKQEQQGESLRTQDSQIKDAIAQLGGVVARRYAGQEHATAGWEREQLDQLLDEAKWPRKPFDAVMVTHPDRWSRDNVKSETGLDLLKDNRIRFFVLAQEQNLYDPTVRLYLAMAASIGSYQASLQSKKSLETRIHRARRGRPTCGKLPYGRTFDKQNEKWGVDAKVQAMLSDAATRYLAGESMANLAHEYGINHPFLHKTLTTGCGTVWEQRFHSAKLGIDETVPIAIPALLEPEIIAAVLRRAAANKTFAHGHLKWQYLFGRMVFCGACGYAMSGQKTAPHGGRYYRHQSRHGATECPLHFHPWVPADLLEETVLVQLADLWGNPKAVEKALADAEPNKAEIDKARKRLAAIEAEQAKIKSGRERILAYIAKGIITDEQAEKRLTAIKNEETILAEESDRLQQRLAGALSPEDRKHLADQVVVVRRRAGSDRRDVIRAAQDPEKMTWEQKRTLVQDVFGDKTPDGKRMGIYISPIDTEPNQKNRRWRYEIRGRLEAAGVLKER